MKEIKRNGFIVRERKRKTDGQTERGRERNRDRGDIERVMRQMLWQKSIIVIKFC